MTCPQATTSLFDSSCRPSLQGMSERLRENLSISLCQHGVIQPCLAILCNLCPRLGLRRGPTEGCLVRHESRCPKALAEHRSACNIVITDIYEWAKVQDRQFARIALELSGSSFHPLAPSETRDNFQLNYSQWNLRTNVSKAFHISILQASPHDNLNVQFGQHNLRACHMRTLPC